jgi:putative tryptophan/tyrosine transport system substrate-binding protein
VNRQTTIDFATRHKLPSIEIGHTWPQLGGLMGFGPDINAMYRRAGAYYVDRILRGTRPADLPIKQPTAFEFSVNRTTAQAGHHHPSRHRREGNALDRLSDGSCN